MYIELVDGRVLEITEGAKMNLSDGKAVEVIDGKPSIGKKVNETQYSKYLESVEAKDRENLSVFRDKAKEYRALLLSKQTGLAKKLGITLEELRMLGGVL